jgi:hypothetical protein
VKAPPVVSTKKGNAFQIARRIMEASKMSVYVGIPASSARDRQLQLAAMAGRIKAKKSKRRDRILKVADQVVNNAELLYIHTAGSPVRHIPPRPVLEPAIAAPGNKEAIAAELAAALKASLEYNNSEAIRRMKRAGMAAQNAARGWFTDARNNWPPNAPRTIREKGSDRPLIDTGALRQAITYVLDIRSITQSKKETIEEEKEKKEHEVKKQDPQQAKRRFRAREEEPDEPQGSEVVEEAEGAAEQAAEMTQGSAVAAAEQAAGEVAEGLLGLI